MLKIFICEDNIKEQEKLKKIVENTILIENYDMELKLVTSNPYKVLEEIKLNPCSGIYFLDVDLGCDINGIELGEKIRTYDPRGFIIFITTHAEMSYLTFIHKVEAMDFIIKDDTYNISQRIQDCIKNAHTRYTATTNDIQKVFSIKVDDKIISIQYDDILFFETSSTVHKVILHSENRLIEFYSKMKDLETLLDDSFCRCHSSYIVNKNNIKEIDKKKRVIYMKNGDTCFASVRGLRNLL